MSTKDLLKEILVQILATTPEQSSCLPSEVQKDIAKLAPRARTEANAFVEKVGWADICALIDAMREWYGGGDKENALKVIERYRPVLALAMDLGFPEETLYRGISLPKKHPLTSWSEGDEFGLNPLPGRSVSSWTSEFYTASVFATPKKGVPSGIVVSLASQENAELLLVPPQDTKRWFDQLFGKFLTYRAVEDEYVLRQSGPLYVKIEMILGKSSEKKSKKLP